MLGRDGYGVNPAAMAIVTGHDGADDCVVSDGDEEEFIVNGQLLMNDEIRVVVRRLVTEDGLPQRHDLAAMCCVQERCDGDGRHVGGYLRMRIETETEM